MTSFLDMVSDYYSSYEYKELRDETKANYEYIIGQVLATNVAGQNFGRVDVNKLTSKMCKLAYDKWCERGIHFANKAMTIADSVAA